jgi:malyl-CoA/(S)-citramalyl-CoA lyase
MAAQERLHRSELAVPGSNRRMLEKAPGLGADVVFLDLEDAVAPEEKERARANVIEALLDLDWSACAVSVRINALDTPWCYRDIVEVVEAAGHRLDLVLVPKVGRPAQLEFVAILLSQIEAARGLAPIGLSALIETAEGMANVEAIAASCPGRLEALVFGVADFAASVGARTTRIGAPSPDYAVLTDPDARGVRERHWGDLWHAALARLVVAARAHGLRPIDGPFGDIGDEEGYLAAARRAAALGCEGKWAVHPAQIPLANEVFSPPEEQVEEARRILAALEQAAAEGKGAVALDGRLVDAASIRMARGLVAKAERLARARGR